jgi:tripartite-type tricarboxylate transporter receptor subunit TctC
MTGVAGRLDAAEPFYQGKTLRVVVASAGGGGSDIVARLMMRHLPRHIPGNPTLVVEKHAWRRRDHRHELRLWQSQT